MKLKEIAIKKQPLLLEGGNVTINDQSADRIDANAREQAVPIIDNGLRAINSAFADYSGKPLWHPSLLASRQFLSGSAFHFFDRQTINDLDFVKAKPTVGDIDTQVDVAMKDDIVAWLQKLPAGSRLGDAVYVGLKDDPLSLGGPQLITLWHFPGIQVKTTNPDGSITKRGTNVQIDLELKEFEVKAGTNYTQPTRWSQFSASSSWQDLSAGVKGVFHKYLIMALTKLTEQNIIVRKPVYNRKTKTYDSFKYSEPTTVPMYTFAVGSREGGGLRPTFIPVMASNGRQEEMDGVPVYDKAETTGYVRDVDRIFADIFGTRIPKRDLKKLSSQFDSFTGLLALSKKYLDQNERQKVADKFREKIIGVDEFDRRAQELYKGDPEKDRTEKLTAYNLLRKTLGVQAPSDFDSMLQNYYGTYDKKKLESITEADPIPDYKRQGIRHIFNRLPDGRASSMEIKDQDFIKLCTEIAENGGTLNNIPINLKIDGAGIRFGRDVSGRPFFMTSKVTKPLYVDDIGSFEQYGKEQGQSQEQLARTRNYDQALATIVNSDFIKRLPDDTIVQAEMLFNPMAQSQDDQLKFVNIAYDAKRLGKTMTLVPFMVKQYSTGQVVPDQDRIIRTLVKSSTPEIKIITNRLEQSGINVRSAIEPVLKMDPNLRTALMARGNSDLKTQARAILDQARQRLSQAIIKSPKLKGMNVLGDNNEGIVLEFPETGLVKITTDTMKSAMAAKNTAPAQTFGDTKPRTAVVAIGNFAGHRGHEQLINFAIERARKEGGTPYIFVGHKVGPDDPIDIKTKLETLRKLFPGVTVSVVENQTDAAGNVTVGNIFKKIEYELIKKPPYFNNIIITVGSDQESIAKRAEQMQARYATFPPLSHVRVSAYITPRQSDAGGTGISTTALRTALKTMPQEQAFEAWSRAYNIQKLGADWIRHLMDIARSNMGIAARTQPPVQTKPAVKSDQFAQEAAEAYRKRLGEVSRTGAGPKFTGYFKGRDKPPVGKRLVGEEIKVNDIVRTQAHRGIVESIEYYRPFGELAVYFRTGDNVLMRTPITNVIKIPQA